jgi:malonate transporter and related proteins
MLDVLAITGPIYIIIALGFASTHWGLFKRADMRVFGQFVINIALPALLFRALSSRPLGEVFNTTYVLAYLLGSLTVLGLGWWGARRLAGQGLAASTFYAMGMTCSNSGFVGYPILLLTLAPVAGVALALCMLVENVFIIPLLLALAERSRGAAAAWPQAVAQALRHLVSNPMVLAIAAGMAASALGWRLPGPLARTVDLFASASGAVSLFAIGGTLVGLPLAGLANRVVPIAAGKLLLHPLAVGSMVLLLPLLGLPALDPTLRTAAVLMAAMPMMGIYPILAQAYGQDHFAAPAMLATTVASFFSLTAVFWLLGSLPAFH